MAVAIAALNGTNPALWSAASLQAVQNAYLIEQSLQGQYANCSKDIVDGSACYQSYKNPNQHVIGTSGVNFVGSAFAASKAANIPFQVWASQTCFFPSSAPDFYSANNPTGVNSRAASANYFPRQSSLNASYASLGASKAQAGPMNKLPWNVDGWDGFQFERQQHLNSMAANANNVIINSGDAHTFWASKLSSNGAGTPNMAEWCGGSVTSPGYGEAYGAPIAGKAIDQSQASLMGLIEDGFMISDAPNLVASRMPKGALVFQVTPKSYVGHMFTVNNIATRVYSPSCDNAFLVPSNAPGSMLPSPCVNTVMGLMLGPMIPVLSQSPPPPSPSPLPPPPSPLSPSPPPFSTTAAPVNLAATLSGYTVTTFTAAHQTAFVSGVALALNVNPSAVTITSVTAAASAGRHLSQSGVTVAFTVLTTSAPMATSTLLASALPTAFTSSFTAAALPVPAVSGISAVAPPPLPTLALSTPTPTTSAGFKAGAVLAAVLAAATALLL